jgi:hypothetical protein
MHAVCTLMYQAGGVTWSEEAEAKVNRSKQSQLYLCMTSMQFALTMLIRSHDAFYRLNMMCSFYAGAVCFRLLPIRKLAMTNCQYV